MEIENLLAAFDIGYKSCQLKKDYYKSKIAFIETLQETLRKNL